MNLRNWLYGALAEWSAAAWDEVDHFRSADGFLAWLGEYALLFPAGMCLIWMVFGLLYVLRREGRLQTDSKATLSIGVVVPARNEEAGIACTIESLLQQDYPLLTVHVVCDACTDRTAERARLFEGPRVFVHELKERHGKAGALQHVLDRIDADLFMVLDADTRCAPGAIAAMTHQFADPMIAGVTGNPRVARAPGLLTLMQTMEYMGIIGLIKRADSFWGGLFTVSGAAACFRTLVLRRVGGWSSASATEDIELSWRMQKAGYELAYEPRALFDVQAPASLRALYRQRIRWARGMWEVLRLHGNLAWTRNAALIPMAAQVVGTVLWMTLALATVALGIVRAASGLEIGIALDGSTALRVLVMTMTLFLAQSFLACTWESHYRSGMWRSLPTALLYPLYYWAIIAPAFVIGVGSALITARRSEVKWERTARRVEKEPKTDPRSDHRVQQPAQTRVRRSIQHQLSSP